MPRAILIAGGAKRFLDEALTFKNYLDTAGIYTILLETAYLGVREFTLKLADILEQYKHDAPDEPVLLIFTGHGGKNGWDLDETEKFPYTTLIVLIKQNPMPLLIINTSCHSFSLAQLLEQPEISKERISLIATCDADEEGYQGLLEDIADTWKKRTPYEPLPKPTETTDAEPEVVIRITLSFRLLCKQIASLYGKWIRAIKRGIVGLDIRHQFVEEEVVNFWPYIKSVFASWMTLGKVPRIRLRINVRLNEKFWIREVSVVRAENGHSPIYGKRWGAILDGHFFPPKET